MARGVQGLEKLRAKLRALPDEVRKEMRAAMTTGAEELVSMQKRLAPVDSGDLRDSIGYSFGEYRAANSNVRGVGVGSRVGDPDLSVTVHAGDAKAYYAAFLEFGTVNMAAHPFFFPAYRALRKRIRSRISRASSNAAKKIAKGGK